MYVYVHRVSCVQVHSQSGEAKCHGRRLTAAQHADFWVGELQLHQRVGAMDNYHFLWLWAAYSIQAEASSTRPYHANY